MKEREREGRGIAAGPPSRDWGVWDEGRLMRPLAKRLVHGVLPSGLPLALTLRPGVSQGKHGCSMQLSAPAHTGSFCTGGAGRNLDREQRAVVGPHLRLPCSLFKTCPLQGHGWPSCLGSEWKAMQIG